MSYVQNGYSGKWVEYLQMSLECLGYDIGPYGIDGKFGNDTENAVCDFQYDHYLEEDGKVGDNTWNKIKSEISPIQQSLINKDIMLVPVVPMVFMDIQQ
jgi:peptidoglycan hydrolase-like protein with peptidoglycan-binding domain